MIKILFVCHGNICRSPMAEFYFKDLVKKRGIFDRFLIESAATSYEEIGNGPHDGTIKILRQLGIDCRSKKARKMIKDDYAKYDYLIGMDKNNITNMISICNGDPDHKIYKLLDFTGISRDIRDPWYTDNFEETFDDVKTGCDALLKKVWS